MQTLSTLEFVTRLGVGLGRGALIGAERRWRARMAGLRTNALVAAGATLFVLTSASAAASTPLGSPRTSCPASVFSAAGSSCATGSTSAA